MRLKLYTLVFCLFIVLNEGTAQTEPLKFNTHKPSPTQGSKLQRSFRADTSMLSLSNDKKSVTDAMRRVADWQGSYFAENGYKRWPIIEWVYSTYYIGLLKAVKLLNDPKYDKAILDYCKNAHWKVGEGKRRFFADDYLIGYLYTKLFNEHHKPEMIADFRQMADSLVERKTDEPMAVNYQTMNVFRVWNWCDAMFMGPPSLFSLSNVTKQDKYRNLADSLFWKSYDYLYDKDEHLWYRDSRYFTQRENNGRKKFWSRGNGWVLAGIARILEELPKKYPSRSRYELLFKQMSQKIITLQQQDGMWRASLLDPKIYPAKETSGTGFYCYALAWGINNGLLKEKTYKSAALKAWQALNECVHPDGKLGFVQKIGDEATETTSEDSDAFGVGAFLLAGTEIIKLK